MNINSIIISISLFQLMSLGSDTSFNNKENVNHMFTDSTFNIYNDSFRIIDTLLIEGKLAIYDLKNIPDEDYKLLSKNFYNNYKKYLISYSFFIDSSISIDEMKNPANRGNYMFLDHFYFRDLNDVHKELYCSFIRKDLGSEDCKKEYRGVSIYYNRKNEVFVNKRDTLFYQDSQVEVLNIKQKFFLVETSVFQFNSYWGGIGIDTYYVKNGMVRYLTPYCKYEIK